MSANYYTTSGEGSDNELQLLLSTNRDPSQESHIATAEKQGKAKWFRPLRISLIVMTEEGAILVL